MDTLSPIHLVMRFADRPHPTGYTIQSHEHVIHTAGAVWLGKLGRKLGNRHIDRINDQCRRGVVSFLYLVQRIEGTYDAHRAQIVQLATRLPPGGGKLVPSYYAESGIRVYVRLWVKVSNIQRIDKRALSNLHVASSLSPVPQTLALSMAGIFVVKEGQGINLR